MHTFKQTFKYDIQMYIYTIWENIQITMMLSDNYSDNYHENGFIIVRFRQHQIVFHIFLAKER